ncbi:MAG: zinc ribbon domain-containing protein [Lachnospiraceae bacterium]|nr:zinc ribbon domain-containing protein [Lachnospiraceae bacterium]
MTVCVNCGASFEETMPECPYCGHMYEAGAQREYMDQLQELKEELSDVTEESHRLYREERNRILKKVLQIMGGAFLIIGGLTLLMTGLVRWIDSGFGESDTKAELIWQNANFPKLDAWYEEGDYDAILSFYDKLLQTEEKGYTAIYGWDHMMLVWDYEMYAGAIRIRDALRAGETLSSYEAREAVSCAMELVYFKNPAMYGEEEKAVLEGWQRKMREFLLGELGFDEAEADRLYEKINRDGYLDYQKCDEYTDKIAERFGSGDT